MAKRTSWIALLLFLICAASMAQTEGKNELGLTLGAEIVPDQQLGAPSNAKPTFMANSATFPLEQVEI